MRFLSLLFIVLLAGCAGHSVSQNEADFAMKGCFAQFAMMADKGRMDRWSQWGQCKKRHVMPLEMRIYSMKEETISPLYDNLIDRFLEFEKTVGSQSDALEQKKLDEIYNLYDLEKAEMGMASCVLWRAIPEGGGTKKCEIWK